MADNFLEKQRADYEARKMRRRPGVSKVRPADLAVAPVGLLDVQDLAQMAGFYSHVLALSEGGDDHSLPAGMRQGVALVDGLGNEVVRLRKAGGKGLPACLRFIVPSVYSLRMLLNRIGNEVDVCEYSDADGTLRAISFIDTEGNHVEVLAKRKNIANPLAQIK